MSSDTVMVAGIRLTKHPVLHLPTEDEILSLVNELGAEPTAKILERREEKIQAEAQDPYRHGFEPESWSDSDELLMKGNELLIMGGNRAEIGRAHV